MKEPINNSKFTTIDNENMIAVPSPDNRLKVVFSYFRETRMGANEYLFSIFDNQDTIIKNFEPLRAINTRNCLWFNDSTFFSLAIRAYEKYGYILVDAKTLNFAFIKVSNPYPLCINFAENKLVIAYKNEQFDLANSSKLVNGKTTELPYKRFKKPEEINLKLESLTFYPIDELQNICKLTELDKEYKLDLIDEGFAEFKGKLPQNTVDGYNGRPFEVYQLETFAEYGDKVSQFWLKLIKEKTNNTYSSWSKVSDYIGKLKRKE